MHPLRVVLHAARGYLLIGADTDVIDTDNIDHVLQPVYVFVQVGKEVGPPLTMNPVSPIKVVRQPRCCRAVAAMPRTRVRGRSRREILPPGSL